MKRKCKSCGKETKLSYGRYCSMSCIKVARINYRNAVIRAIKELRRKY